MGKIKHIAIQVPDLEKAAAFYENVFDLKRVNQVESPMGNAISLSDGDMNLTLLHFPEGTIGGKGEMNNRMTAIFFEMLAGADIDLGNSKGVVSSGNLQRIAFDPGVGIVHVAISLFLPYQTRWLSVTVPFRTSIFGTRITLDAKNTKRSNESRRLKRLNV